MSDAKHELKEKTESAPALASNPISERETKVLKFWQERDIFKKSLKQPSPKGNFVFYDGPPFATGLPHFGHALASTEKDVIPRYKTMRGYHVPRRWGWDCHGLPIENLVEKELGLKNKRDIEEIGVDKFNKAARDSVLRYTDEWKQIIPRLGRFVDMENDYRSMDSTYTESVWWSYKELNKKGLVYEDYKVMPYCPRCGTTLSNFEVNLGYKDIVDISAYVKFKIADESNTYFLAWTTTPWTLPGNVALAVNPDISYVKIGVKVRDTEDGKGGEATDHEKNVARTPIKTAKYILAKDRLAIIKDTYEIVDEYKGSELVGKTYTPVFDYYTNPKVLTPNEQSKLPNAFKVYGADFVTAEDGTGIVHVAPAFGDDDLKLARKEQLPVIHHVGMDGIFKDTVTDFKGMTAKEIDGKTPEKKDAHQHTDIEIIKWLAHHNSLFAKEKYTHSYPHCWRCDTPLLNYATSSWFVRVTAMKDRLVAANKKIKWVPEAIGEGRFGKWLEGARDWAVSRSRYWGAPIPVWKGEKTGKTEFIGSISELKSKLPTHGNSYVFMRHGQANANVSGVISSKNKEESGLTEIGKDEVKNSAQTLKERWGLKGASNSDDIIIYRSEFRRTRETSEIVAKTLGVPVTDILVDSRLNEINAGDFDGSPWSKWSDYFTSNHETMYKKMPNGESVDDVRKRMAEFLYEVHAKHKNSRILIVTHGSPLRMAKQIAAGIATRSLFHHFVWHDSDPTASLHPIDFRALPHNEEFEIDLHRPYIDQITWQSDDGAEHETMRRVPEIFDVWYDSGSMPFAQIHYPFEHHHKFDARNSSLFPADFIAEGIDQTRGWFYLLLVMSIGLFNKAAFKNVIVNGLVLAEDGRKMSKSLKNYAEIGPTIDKYGADALRFSLLSSPLVQAEDVSFSEKILDEVNKKHFNRLSNVFTFYDMYAKESRKASALASRADLSRPADPKNILDKWIIARLDELTEQVTKGLDGYELDRAIRPFASFIDDLSTWYLRRSRDRFKGDDAIDRDAALHTTRFVLYTLSLLLAPFTPFYAEDLYQKLTGIEYGDKYAEAGAKGFRESVHLESWPEIERSSVLRFREKIFGKSHSRARVLESMATARQIVETGLALRSKAAIKVRQPLAGATYEFTKKRNALTAQHEQMIADELNVKKVSIAKDKGGEELDGIKFVLDTHITKELEEEGLMRDVVRAIQEARKEANLSPSDVISIHIEDVSAQVSAAITSYEDTIKKITSAKTIKVITGSGEMKVKVHKVTRSETEGENSF